MTNFTDLTFVLDLLVEWFTGTYAILGLFIIGLFLVMLLARGIDVRYAVGFVIPLLVFFVLIGWFGTVTNSQWIANFAMIVIGMIYGFALIRIST